MKNIKAVIFDLDDTLYPEIDYVRSGFKSVSRYLSSEFGFEAAMIYENLLKLFEEDKASVFDRFISLNGIHIENLNMKCVDVYRYNLPDIHLQPDVAELMQWLRTKGFKIGIITDGRPEGQWNKIKALELEKYCSRIIVTDELGGPEFRKPCEVPYKKMLEALCVQPEESMYVGDNPVKDFVTANRLGIDTVMLRRNDGIYNKYTDAKPEYLARISVSEISEIKKYLKVGD